MPRKKKTKVFVSYSRHDEALVKPLAGLLGVAAEDAVFLDVEQLKPGDLWEDKLVNAVKESSVFVLCWCCQSQHSEFVAKEIGLALEDKNRRLVPVLFCATELPGDLAKRQWIDLRGKVVHVCEHSPLQHKAGSPSSTASPVDPLPPRDAPVAAPMNAREPAQPAAPGPAVHSQKRSPTAPAKIARLRSRTQDSAENNEVPDALPEAPIAPPLPPSPSPASRVPALALERPAPKRRSALLVPALSFAFVSAAGLCGYLAITVRGSAASKQHALGSSWFIGLVAFSLAGLASISLAALWVAWSSNTSRLRRALHRIDPPAEPVDIIAARAKSYFEGLRASTDPSAKP